ncbi:hypothetical protein, partial [Achromobacter ruhlandii]|uniref:hypothetical protein n=1 Tax=Achromobacter ruhlandii TaxID=72557 RepID=UPI001C12C1B3
VGKGGNPSAAELPLIASKVPGVVRSRINLWKGDSNQNGWNHVVREHFSGKLGKSQFTISQSELRAVLQSTQVVSSPIVRIVVHDKGHRYFREVDLERPIGRDRFNNNDPTSFITVLTNKRGDLITVTPGKMK